MIDGDNQLRRAQGFDVGHQGFELRHIVEIAAEQNHAADSGVKQALFFFISQHKSVNIGHNRTAREVGSVHIVLWGIRFQTAYCRYIVD